MGEEKEVKRVGPDAVLIDETTTGRIYFRLIYPTEETCSIHPYIRDIYPSGDKDFINWMYEFIRFWGIHPEAYNEEIKDNVNKRLSEDEKWKKLGLSWKEKFLFTNIEMIKKKEKWAKYRLSTQDLINTLKVNGIDITERTIRYYEAEKLLPKPLKVGKFKKYSLQAVQTLKKIKALQQEGKTIKEIRNILTAK